MKILTHIPDKYVIDSVTGIKGQAGKVFLPVTVDEVVQVVQEAAAANQSLITRGAGTGLTSATFPSSNEWILDMTDMNRIVALDTSTMTLTVEPGVTLQEIQDYLKGTGLFYAPDPGSKEASIGGTVATNAGGMRAVKYGVTRDNVRGLEIVMASGEVLKVGGLTNKNSSGYDMKNLFIGSEGTLGIITSIQLKLRPEPAEKCTLVAGFASLNDIAPAVLAILASGITPTALEFFQRDGIMYASEFLKLPFQYEKGEAFLLLTIDGSDKQQVQKELTAVQQILTNQSAIACWELTEAEEAIIWQLRGAIVSGVEAQSPQEPLDIVVPIPRIPETIDQMKKIAADYGLDAVCFGHAGDGNIHACILRHDLSEAEWTTALAATLKELYHFVACAGGLPSAEHGIGLLKKDYFQAEINPILLQAMKQIKQTFDPTNLLNPKKIFDL